MNKLNPQKQIVAALVEGNSIRATCRMTGVAKGTVLKLLADVDKVCADYQDKVFRELTCEYIQCDEIWSFCYAKEKNVPRDKQGKFGYGDVWTFTALCAESKLVPSWYVGSRDLHTATAFMKDLAGRLKNKVQLTTDGHNMYLEAVEDAFGPEVDFSQLIKMYGKSQEYEARYSPAQCTGIRVKKIQGDPDTDTEHVSTSYVERQKIGRAHV